jgi:hypothetical protein
MNAVRTLRRVSHIAYADLLERIRRPGFLIVLASAVFAGYLFVPPVGAGYRVVQVGTQRGIYDSAWIGLMFGLIAALHLPLAGFFLVKNAVERDRQTRVGQIIATTPTSKAGLCGGQVVEQPGRASFYPECNDRHGCRHATGARRGHHAAARDAGTHDLVDGLAGAGDFCRAGRAF